MTFSGWFDLPWWGIALVALASTHVTIAAVTIYLHRCKTHIVGIEGVGHD